LAGPSHNSVQSYNNHIGVPLTLARTPRETAFAVFEIGMNHAGEIGPLSKMVRPHVAVITMVGPVHIENFPDGEAGVARAKAEIFEGMEPGGIVVLNADDAWFGLLSDAATGAGLEVRTFGTGEGRDARLIDFRASPIEGKGAIVHATLHGAPISFPIAQTSAHWGLNALATLLAVEALGAPMDAAIRALSDFAPLAGRGVQMRIAIPGGGVTLIDDSYNANPVSMRAALTTLGAYKTTGRRIAVLTDMLEMGADTDAIHAALAEPIAAAKVDAVYCAGPAMQALYDALPAARRGAWRQAAADLAPLVVEILAPDDVIMVKGSKGSKASLVVAALASLGEAR
jgi:UDP-N-acetylmuramoyl-tripeptide--D-alanyl-D-alanine ligase